MLFRVSYFSAQDYVDFFSSLYTTMVMVLIAFTATYLSVLLMMGIGVVVSL